MLYVVLYWTGLYRIGPHCVVLCGAALLLIVMLCFVLLCLVLCCIVLGSTVLYIHRSVVCCVGPYCGV